MAVRNRPPGEPASVAPRRTSTRSRRKVEGAAPEPSATPANEAPASTRAAKTARPARNTTGTARARADRTPGAAPTPASATPRETTVSLPTRPHERWVRQACKLTEAEYGALSSLKKRAAALARPMKRGELLRVGLQVLAALDDAALFAVLDRAAVPRRSVRRTAAASE